MSLPASSLLDAEASERPAAFERSIDFFERVFTDWLQQPSITIACGAWRDGAIMELVPEGRGQLLPPKYEDCFLGVRELQVEGAKHHLHVDLGRLHSVEYRLTPSVCLGYRPAFEVAFMALGCGNSRSDACPIWIMLSEPYARDGSLHGELVERWIDLFQVHQRARPDLTTLVIEPATSTGTESQQLLNLVRSRLQRADAGWSESIAMLDAVVLPCAPKASR